MVHGHVSVVSSMHKVLIRPGPEVIKLFSCSTELSMKFKLLTITELTKQMVEISGSDCQSL